MVPEGWMECSVGELLSGMNAGVSVNSKNVPCVGTQMGILKTSAVSDGIFKPMRNKLVDEEIEISRLKEPVESDTIVISRMNTPALVGANGYVEHSVENIFLPDRLWALKSIGDVNCRWLSFWFASDHTRFTLSSLATGTSGSMKNITKGDVRSMRVDLPPLPEQRKIAEILSTWDRAIEVSEALLTTARTQKRALMQSLLTGQRRFPEFEGQDWKEVRLGDVIDCLDNKRVPLNATQRNEIKGDIPYWGANGIVDYINDYIFDEPLVLLAEDGGYFDEFAKRPIASISYGKAWVNNHAHILRAGPQVNTEWLYYSLVHKNILGFINSGTRAKLNKGDMLKIPLVMPTKEEQLQISDVIGVADTEEKTLAIEVQHLRTEKKALMQQLLTGKRRVTV